MLRPAQRGRVTTPRGQRPCSPWPSGQRKPQRSSGTTPSASTRLNGQRCKFAAPLPEQRMSCGHSLAPAAAAIPPDRSPQHGPVMCKSSTSRLGRFSASPNCNPIRAARHAAATRGNGGGGPLPPLHGELLLSPGGEGKGGSGDFADPSMNGPCEFLHILTVRRHP